MALQSAVFALQGLSNHSAALFRQALTSMLSAGGTVATGELAISAQSTPNMSVQVAAGRAWLPGSQVAAVAGVSPFTTQAAYFGLNDAPVTVTIAAADSTNPRVDLIYLAVQDAFYSGANNAPVLGVVTGTPAASPQVPAAPANAVSLGYAYVTANATSITSGNAVTFSGTNVRLRGGTYVCTSSSHPQSPAAGWLIYETDTNHLLVWNGSAWVNLDGLAPVAPVLTGSFAAFSTTDLQSLRMWTQGRTGFASGFIKTTASIGVGDVQVATIPAGMAPTLLNRVSGVASFGNTTQTPVRMDAWSASSTNPSWLSISASATIASGTNIAVNMHWPLG